MSDSEDRSPAFLPRDTLDIVWSCLASARDRRALVLSSPVRFGSAVTHASLRGCSSSSLKCGSLPRLLPHLACLTSLDLGSNCAALEAIRADAASVAAVSRVTTLRARISGDYDGEGEGKATTVASVAAAFPSLASLHLVVDRADPGVLLSDLPAQLRDLYVVAGAAHPTAGLTSSSSSALGTGCLERLEVYVEMNGVGGDYWFDAVVRCSNLSVRDLRFGCTPSGATSAEEEKEEGVFARARAPLPPLPELRSVRARDVAICARALFSAAPLLEHADVGALLGDVADDAGSAPGLRSLALCEWGDPDVFLYPPGDAASEMLAALTAVAPALESVRVRDRRARASPWRPQQPTSLNRVSAMLADRSSAGASTGAAVSVEFLRVPGRRGGGGVWQALYTSARDMHVVPYVVDFFP